MFKGYRPDGSSWDVPIDVRDEQIWRIGRHPSSNMLIHDAQNPLLASRYHAQITRAPDQHSLWLEDTGSTNETYVNNVPIRGALYMLRHGDIVCFGGPSNILLNGEVTPNPFRFEYISPSVASSALVSPQPRRTGLKRRRENTQRDPAPPPQLTAPNESSHERTVSLSAVNKALECPVCQDLLLAPQIFGACGHIFCSPCIDAWLRRKGRNGPCPVCRTQAAERPALACALETLIVDIIEPQLTDAERLERAQRRREWTTAQSRQRMPLFELSFIFRSSRPSSR